MKNEIILRRFEEREAMPLRDIYIYQPRYVAVVSPKKTREKSDRITSSLARELKMRGKRTATAATTKPQINSRKNTCTAMKLHK